METWASKVMIIFIVLGISLLFGLVPLKIVNKLKFNSHTSRSRTQRVISLLNCFAGGVFLATTFLHLLPEVKEGMEALLEERGVETSFPITEFMVTGGMFVIMFIEHLVMTVQHHQGDVSFPSSSENSYEEKQPLCHSQKDEEEQHSQGILKTNLKNYGSVHKEGKVLYRSVSSKEERENLIQSTSIDKVDNEDNCHGIGSERNEECEGIDVHIHDTRQTKEQTGQRRRDVVCASHRDVVLEEGACVHVIKSTHHQHHHMEPQQLGGIRSFLFLLAMSIHTVFEGLAIGLQPNNTAVWSLFAAVIIHKCVIAFSLGIQFAENLQHTGRAVLFVVFFAVMSPLGTAIGTAMTETTHGGSESVDIASTILQGLSTGVFLYVTFFESLGSEVGSDHSLIKVGLIVLGYSAIAIIQLLIPEPEENGN